MVMAVGALLVTTAAWRCMAFVIWYVNANCNLPISSPSGKGEDLEATIRLREELAEHRHALLQIQEMAAKYGFDIFARRRMRRKRCSGSTSLIWRQ